MSLISLSSSATIMEKLMRFLRGGGYTPLRNPISFSIIVAEEEREIRDIYFISSYI